MKKYVWDKRSPEWIKDNPGKGTMYKVELIEGEPAPINALAPVRREYNKKLNVHKECDVGVYLVLCEVSKSVYVGQSRNMGTRMRNHKAMILGNRKSSICYDKMRSDYKVYGIGAFKFVRYIKMTLAYADDLLKTETRVMMEYMDKGYTLYNSLIPGANMYCPPHLMNGAREYINSLINK